MISRSKYGASLATFARFLERDGALQGDPTFIGAQALGRAYLAMKMLASMGIDLCFRDRMLVLSHLDAAWRELLYLRVAQNANTLDESVLTRYGRLNPAVLVRSDLGQVEPEQVVAQFRPRIRRVRRTILHKRGQEECNGE